MMRTGMEGHGTPCPYRSLVTRYCPSLRYAQDEKKRGFFWGAALKPRAEARGEETGINILLLSC